MSRRDPRRLDESARRARALLRELEAQLPSAERLTDILEQLANLSRESPRAVPATAHTLIQRALLHSHRAAHAALAISTRT